MACKRNPMENELENNNKFYRARCADCVYHTNTRMYISSSQLRTRMPYCNRGLT